MSKPEQVWRLLLKGYCLLGCTYSNLIIIIRVVYSRIRSNAPVKFLNHLDFLRWHVVVKNRRDVEQKLELLRKRERERERERE